MTCIMIVSHTNRLENFSQSPCTVPNCRYFPRSGYSSSSRAGRLGRTLWPQNSTSVAETEKGGQNSTMTPPTLEKGGQYSTSVWKVCKKGGQKSTIPKNIGVKILQVWKWGSKFYMLKNRGQNSTMLEKRGVNILHPTPKVEVKIPYSNSPTSTRLGLCCSLYSLG